MAGSVDRQQFPRLAKLERRALGLSWIFCSRGGRIRRSINGASLLPQCLIASVWRRRRKHHSLLIEGSRVRWNMVAVLQRHRQSVWRVRRPTGVASRERSQRVSSGQRRQPGSRSQGGVTYSSRWHSHRPPRRLSSATMARNLLLFVVQVSRVVDRDVEAGNGHRRRVMLLWRVVVVGVRQRSRVGSVAVRFRCQIAQQVQQQPSLDVHQRFLVVFLEFARGMAELPDGAILDRQHRALGLQHLVEAVHMELPHKRRHVAVLEIAAEGVGKFFGGVKRKRVGVRGVGPPDEVGEFRVAEHGEEFVDESVFLDWRIGSFGEHQRHYGHLGLAE